MCLLLTSERVFVDLLAALECQNDEHDTWSTSLILREWDDDLRHDWEFRCFVRRPGCKSVSEHRQTPPFFFRARTHRARLKGGGKVLRRRIRTESARMRHGHSCHG